MRNKTPHSRVSHLDPKKMPQYIYEGVNPLMTEVF